MNVNDNALEKEDVMFVKNLLVVCTFLVSLSSLAQSFDCSLPTPEMPGLHNMVLFGNPSDQLYAYHLPLFAGQVNGENGHVLMHVYQGLFSVKLDGTTMMAYKQKFLQKQTTMNPIPFFSFSPRGDRFKVPEMICNEGFTTSILTVYGHVESNPQFPAPEVLVNQLSTITKEKTIFAQRFNGSSKSELSYILFGTPQQYYLAHYLTDDENSFDQIVAIKNLDDQLKTHLISTQNIILEVPPNENTNLLIVDGHQGQHSPNNRLKLPSAAGKTVTLNAMINGVNIQTTVQIVSEVYFNANTDLSIEP
tara:strand:+ start:12944 stop:13861 length:918 start_codon:yes stop_codon:yes gene_type:complete